MKEMVIIACAAVHPSIDACGRLLSMRKVYELSEVALAS